MFSKKIGVVVVMVVVVILAYGLITQIWSAFGAERRLSYEFEKLSKLQIKNQELKKTLAQAKSPEFIEAQARDKLGLAKDGETIFIVPKEKIEQILGLSKKVEEIKLPNWQGWLRVFWH